MLLDRRSVLPAVLGGLLLACTVSLPVRAAATGPLPVSGQPAETSTQHGSGHTQAPNWHRVVVDLSEQRLTAYDRNGNVVAQWDVSTGAPETPTPTGRFRVTSKSRHTFVVKNPRITMEHMVRFRGGIGFHSIPRRDGRPLPTPLGERGVSHGCIRLPDEHARVLYRRLPIGSEVIVRP